MAANDTARQKVLGTLDPLATLGTCDMRINCAFERFCALKSLEAPPADTGGREYLAVKTPPNRVKCKVVDNDLSLYFTGFSRSRQGS